MAADALTADELAAMQKRDEICAATWFAGPVSDKSQCFRDRRALLAEVKRLKEIEWMYQEFCK